MGTSDIETMYGILEKLGGINYFLIYFEKISPQSIVKLNKFGVNIGEVFSYQELSFNVSRHVLVPKHELVINKSKFLRDNNITVQSLPEIKSDDAMVRYYNWKIGSIVKITRNKTYLPEDTIYYRLIVA